VTLTRIPDSASDPERFEVRWAVADGRPSRLELELRAELELPRLLPVGAVAETAADRLLGAAVRELSSARGGQG
jgi:hypothetical protein